MSNSKKIVAKALKATAEKALKRDANKVTCTIFFQPKVPADLDKFKKNKA